MSEYKFKEAKNTACISCKHIVDDNDPILYVSHDADDGGWQFLCGRDSHLEEDAKVIGLEEITVIDPQINYIADMPLGVLGERENPKEKWVFYRNN